MKFLIQNGIINIEIKSNIVIKRREADGMVLVEEQTQEVETMSIAEQMESQMSISWDEIDVFLDSIEGSSRADSKSAWGREWQHGKSEIFKAWGNKLKIEKDVELSLSEREVINSIKSVLRSVGNEVSEKTHSILSLAFSALSKEEIIDNKVMESREWFNGSIKLNKGMKLSRALGRLITDSVEKDIFQTHFSMALQSFKVAGKVVMSIDPIDIINMSYNPENSWRSCHCVVDGEYRAGVFSYLIDSSTFMGYVYKTKAQSHYMSSGILIPNKSWRQVGYYSDSMDQIALSTNYPSFNSNNQGTLVDLIIENSDVDVDKITHGSVDPDNLNMYDDGELHYNDISNGRSSEAILIDFTGKGKHYDDADGFARSGDVNTFYVGNESPSSYDSCGYLDNPGYISEDGYDENDYEEY